MNVDQHPSPGSSKAPEKRGRKRTRTVPQPAPPAATLVVTKRNPNARSPTPPSRVVKSTYGGNLFTPEDIEYLRKYIQYCQDQGLVLSLREICERIAVKVNTPCSFCHLALSLTLCSLGSSSYVRRI